MVNPLGKRRAICCQIATFATKIDVVIPSLQGVGWDVQTVSDGLVSMRIVDSNGDLRTYSMADDLDMMRAVQCNLGLWGIIVDLTLSVCTSQAVRLIVVVLTVWRP